MARTFSSDERAWIAGDQSVYLELTVENADGTFIDISDRVVSAVLEDDVDKNSLQMTCELARDNGGDGSESLSPLMENSTLNVDDLAAYAPLLDAGRRWKLRTAVVPHGEAREFGDWQPMGEGTYKIVSVLDRPDIVRITGRDPGASLLDQMIEDVVTYSPASDQAMEDVIQAILDDNGLSSITLYTPTSPSFVMNAWEQATGVSVMEAVNEVAKLAGMVCRYRYDSSDNLRLTLYAPDRTATPGDEEWTLGPSEYTQLPIATIDGDGIRNRIVIKYYRASTDAVETATDEDATSIARYSPLGLPYTLFIDLSKDSNVVTPAGAADLAAIILADLKDPPFFQQIVVPGFWIAQVGDYGKFLVNAVHYDLSDQYGAVTSSRMEWANGQLTVTLGIRGQPQGRYRTWTKMRSRLAAPTEASSGTLAIDDTGTVKMTIYGAAGVSAHLWMEDSSAFPSREDVIAFGAGVTLNTGRQATVDLTTTLAAGEAVYVTVVPCGVIDGSGFFGPESHFRAIRHDEGATKTLRLSAQSCTFWNDGTTNTPFTNIQSYGGGVRVLSTSADNIFGRIYPSLAKGLTITAVRARVWRDSSSDTVKLSVFSIDNDGTFTTEGTPANAASSGVFETVEVSSLSVSTSGNATFLAEIRMDPNTSGGLVACMWFEFDYTSPSLTVST